MIYTKAISSLLPSLSISIGQLSSASGNPSHFLYVAKSVKIDTRTIPKKQDSSLNNIKKKSLKSLSKKFWTASKTNPSLNSDVTAFPSATAWAARPGSITQLRGRPPAAWPRGGVCQGPAIPAATGRFLPGWRCPSGVSGEEGKEWGGFRKGGGWMGRGRGGEWGGFRKGGWMGDFREGGEKGRFLGTKTTIHSFIHILNE